MRIENIIIHCSASSFGSAALIRQWHLERGWKDIGYHFVITNGSLIKNWYMEVFDGSVEQGRIMNDDLWLDDKEIGAHALGYNKNSIGICLIGSQFEEFTIKQFMSLYKLVNDLRQKFNIPINKVLGHYEVNLHKICPCIDMDTLRAFLENNIINVNILKGRM